jgi:hypothetical protein
VTAPFSFAGVEVRPAEQSDRPEILAMCHELHSDNGIFTFDESRVNQVLDKHYDRSGGIIGVIGSTGALEACCALIFSDLWYTTEWHIAELFNYVKPEYRKSHNADALMEFGKECSRRIGLPLIGGVITNRQTVQKVRLYRRRFGAPAGAFFVLNAIWKNETISNKDFSQLFEERADKRKRERREHVSVNMRPINGTALPLG